MSSGATTSEERAKKNGGGAGRAWWLWEWLLDGIVIIGTSEQNTPEPENHPGVPYVKLNMHDALSISL